MSDDLRISFDVSRFNRALLAYAENSKRDMGEIMEQQARLVLRNVVELTPPGKPGVKGTAAKKLGEASVKGDVRRLFSPVRKAQAEETALASIHQQARNNKGRVPKRVGKHRVYSADFNRYLRAQVQKVGSLAGGWNEAARKLGYNPPAWIRRHNSPGSAEVRVGNEKLSVTMTNRVDYASDQKGLERRIDLALRKQEQNLVRQVDKYMGDNSPFRKK